MNILIVDTLFEAGCSFFTRENRRTIYIPPRGESNNPNGYVPYNLSNIARLYAEFEYSSNKLSEESSEIDLLLPESNAPISILIVRSRDFNLRDADLVIFRLGDKYPYDDENPHEKAVNTLNKYLNFLLPSLRDKINIKEVECSSGDEYNPDGVPILVLGPKEILNYPVDLLDFS